VLFVFPENSFTLVAPIFIAEEAPESGWMLTTPLVNPFPTVKLLPALATTLPLTMLPAVPFITGAPIENSPPGRATSLRVGLVRLKFAVTFWTAYVLIVIAPFAPRLLLFPPELFTLADTELMTVLEVTCKAPDSNTIDAPEPGKPFVLTALPPVALMKPVMAISPSK
jgi:hypothetical protein